MKNSYFGFKLNGLLAILLGTILIITIPKSAVASNDPIWEFPAMPDLGGGLGYECMADAYLTDGGKGLKDIVDVSALNCTANDIEITDVDVKGVIVNGILDNDGSDGFTCNRNEPFTLIADVTVKTNADTRYDTTFYLPLNEKSPQTVQGDTSSCSLIVPNPDASRDGEGDGPLVSGDPDNNNDGDTCGDIDKSELTNDDYVLENAEFTMLCATASPDTKQVIFDYCAAWSVKDENDCSVNFDDAILGQRPSQTSKCNCGELPINVFVSPEPPTITKTLIPPTTALELDGTFEYQFLITKSQLEDIVYITSLFDIIYTDPDATPAPDGQVEELINVLAPTTVAGSVFGNVEIVSNTCNPTLTDGKYKIDENTPSFTCNLKVKITDGNLPDDLQLGAPTVRNQGPNPLETYWDYMYGTFEDKNTTSIHDEQASCNLLSLHGDLNTVIPTTAVCSDKEPVTITNVDPEVSISKVVVVPDDNTLGLRQIGDIWYINKSGNVTFEVTVNNPSNNNVDAIWASDLDIASSSSFRDDWVIKNPNNSTDTFGTTNLYTDATGDVDCRDIPKVSVDPGLAVGAEFGPCEYTVNLGLTEGQTYQNTVKIEAVDNENRLAYAAKTVQIKLAAPMVSLKKFVAAASIDDSNATPGTYKDANTVGDSVHIDEPGGYVIYRFTITNDNDTTMEPLKVTGIDDTLYDLANWPAGINDTPDRCTFPQIIEYSSDDSTAYVCTFVTKIENKNALDKVENVAFATAFLWDPTGVGSTIGEQVNSPTDNAIVILDDVPAIVSLDIKIAATLFVTITNGSSFESVDLTELKLRVGNNPADIINIEDTIDARFIILNDGGTFNDDSSFNPCPQPSESAPTAIAALGVLKCAFTVELIADDDSTDNIFSILSSGAILSIKVNDDDLGAAVEKSVTATVHLIPNP
ncbi:hypothetical protein PE36_04046 [Moritella sp. PE36]|nr:hypothetical protein PE36_04046 [Moritella sp. PE36]